MPLSGKLKILFLNTYPKGRAYDMYEKGLLPRHHLFGAPELQKEHDMEVIRVEQEKYSIINKIGDWFDIGLLDQQIRAIFMLSKCDVLYAPFGATNTKLIILGKLFGFIRKPVVILVHHFLFGKPSKNKWKRLLAKKLILSYDTIIFLSETMRTELINAYAIDPVYAEKHFYVSHWGVDMDFFRTYSKENIPDTKQFLISSGKTLRDFDILIRASERINFAFKIYCDPESFPRSSSIPRNVEILSGSFPFEQICKDYDNARMILIPLAPDPEGTVGFTSLLEAMAMGKPVIMTKNDQIDVDFESEKIGMVVEENDVDGWVKAISLMLDDYSLLKEMGDNNARLGNEKFHIKIFAKDLSRVLLDTYQRYISK